MQKSPELQKNKKERNPHISLSHENFRKLQQLGTCGMSYNDVLTKILDHIPDAYKQERTDT